MPTDGISEVPIADRRSSSRKLTNGEIEVDAIDKKHCKGKRRASVRARFAVDENATLGDSPVLQNHLNPGGEELGRQRHT